MNRRDFVATSTAAAAAVVLPALLPRWAKALPTRFPAPMVNAARLNARLAALAEFGKNPQGGISRVAYSDANKAALSYVMQEMRDAGLEVSLDAAANIIGRRSGSNNALPPILFGSHIDSVPGGGNYDGQVGSMGALEVAHTLIDARVVTEHPLEVVIFQNEEGGLIGSHAMTGGLTTQELANVSNSGKTIREGIAFLGGNPDNLASARRQKGDIFAYLELHIEQGGVLHQRGLDIGIVEGIVGIKQWEVTVDGFANHAGTTAMRGRRDALLATARFVDAVNRIILAEPGRQVGTVGRIQALPGAPNVIPGRVISTLEIRDLDGAKIEKMYTKIAREAAAIGKATGTTFAFRLINHNIPAPTALPIRPLIAAAAKELRLTSLALPSGAGHDAQDIAQICPVGMIFVPSVDGISHAPKEFSTPQAIANGANVLLRTLLALDTKQSL